MPFNPTAFWRPSGPWDRCFFICLLCFFVCFVFGDRSGRGRKINEIYPKAHCQWQRGVFNSTMWKSPPSIALHATTLLLLVYLVINGSLYYLCILMCMGDISLLQVQLEFKAHGVAIIQYWEKSIEALGEVVCLAAQPFYKFDGFLLRTSGIHSKAPLPPFLT